jgi:NAD(P)-dependent dehydrogenase (short-subunit alcohol dehydrogenase family)
VIARIAKASPDVKVQFIRLDLGSLKSVRKAAAEINSQVAKIDLLINNAAIMACPYAKTEDGIESQFGTNHIGHFLLTKLLMDKIIAAGPGSRIVNVSSSAIRGTIRYDDYNFQVRRAGSPFLNTSLTHDAGWRGIRSLVRIWPGQDQ